MVRWGIEQIAVRPFHESEMAHSITELDVCTDEQLDHMLPDVLTKARAQLLSDPEVRAFWWVHDEIQLSPYAL
jgi:hypothetical protein